MEKVISHTLIPLSCLFNVLFFVNMKLAFKHWYFMRCVCVCVCDVASRPSVTGQGGAGVGMQLPGWHSEGESAEGHGAGVYQLLFRPQEPHSVRNMNKAACFCSFWTPLSGPV